MQPKVGVAYQLKPERADNVWPLACLRMHINVCFYVSSVFHLWVWLFFDGCTSSLASYSVTLVTISCGITATITSLKSFNTAVGQRWLFQEQASREKPQWAPGRQKPNWKWPWWLPSQLWGSFRRLRRPWETQFSNSALAKQQKASRHGMVLHQFS